ncbi:MAG: hypothetical protein KH449_05835 [Lachnospiraceae bacterium]|nr:hypothetical protein [Lachnospiraceae bacterium]
MIGQYLKAEALKHKHTSMLKLLILMPVVCAMLAAVLTHVFFAVDGYNWWYMGIYPGLIALICGMLVGKEKKMKNRAILALPCDMGRIWDAKVLYGILVSGAAMVLLMILVIGIAFLLEHVLNVTFIIRPSLFRNWRQECFSGCLFAGRFRGACYWRRGLEEPLCCCFM